MKKLCGLIVFFFFATISSAQTAGVSFMIASPQGEFRNNVDNLGFGVQVEGHFGLHPWKNHFPSE